MKENELHSSDVYKKYFASLSREEFKQLLVDAGFEIVEDGGGNVIIEEDCCDLEKRLICELERRLVSILDKIRSD